MAASGVINPVPIQQYFDSNGDPLSGGKLYFYLAGTSTPTPVYADIGMLTPLSNPVILDAAGRAPAIYLDAKTYKEVLQTSSGVTIWTADNITSPSAIPPAPSPEPDPAVVTIVNGGANFFNIVLPAPRSFYYVRVFPQTADINLQSCTAGRQGDQVLIEQVAGGTTYITKLWHQAMGGGDNRNLINRVTSGQTLLAEGGSALYVYDEYGTGWRLAQHDQGKAIRVPYSAANFSVSYLSGSWTVEAGDVIAHDYFLRGNEAFVTFAVNATSIGGANPIHLSAQGLPWTSTQRAATMFVPAIIEDSAGPWHPLLAFGLNNGIGLQLPNFTPFPASTDATAIRAQLTILVN